MAGIKTRGRYSWFPILDETAMNVAQELGDADLYNYDVLVKLLSDRFDPASIQECRRVDPASMATHVVIMRMLIHSRTLYTKCVGWDILRGRRNCDRS